MGRGRRPAEWRRIASVVANAFTFNLRRLVACVARHCEYSAGCPSPGGVPYTRDPLDKPITLFEGLEEQTFVLRP
jgi:hypothetical protein